MLNPIAEESLSDQLCSPDPIVSKLALDDIIRRSIKREPQIHYSPKVQSSSARVDTLNVRTKTHRSHGHDRKSSYTSQVISPFKLIPHNTTHNQTSDFPINTLTHSLDSINFKAISRKESQHQTQSNEITSGSGRLTNATSKSKRDKAQEMFSKCLLGKNSHLISKFKGIL